MILWGSNFTTDGDFTRNDILKYTGGIIVRQDFHDICV